MRIYKLTNFAQVLNAALDSGTSHDITNDQVLQHIDNGTIFEFLSDRLEFSGSISVLEPVDRLELLVEWDILLDRLKPCMADRRLNGLRLLLDYLLEGIARRAESPGYRLTPETCGKAHSDLGTPPDADREAPPRWHRKSVSEIEPASDRSSVSSHSPATKVCTTCGQPCDPMPATAETRRPSICLCCCCWFCEPCLFDHQKSPECDNPFLQSRRKEDERNQQTDSSYE